MKHLFFFSFLSLFFLLNACRKFDDIPIEPAISLKSAVAKRATDQLGNPVKEVKITISLLDGDGDVGFDDQLTVDNETYNFNVYTTIYGMTESGFQKIEDIPENLQNYRIPRLPESIYRPSIKADVEIAFSYPINVLTTRISDTLRYEVFITDRQLHASNTIITDTIFVK